METYIPSSDSINELVGPTYSIKSMYEYMSDLCQRNSMVFIAMPLLYGFNISDGNYLTRSHIQELKAAILTDSHMFVYIHINHQSTLI